MEKYIKQLEKEILDFQTDWNNGSAVMEVSYVLNDNELNIIAKINNKSFSFYVCNGISKTAILERAINTIGIIGLNKLYTDKIKGLRNASLTLPLIKDVDRKNIAKFPLTYDEVFEFKPEQITENEPIDFPVMINGNLINDKKEHKLYLRKAKYPKGFLSEIQMITKQSKSEKIDKIRELIRKEAKRGNSYYNQHLAKFYEGTDILKTLKEEGLKIENDGITVTISWDVK